MPATATSIPWIDLYETSPYGSAYWVVNLAQNVDPQTGRADIVVPDVQPGPYFVMGIWPIQYF